MNANATANILNSFLATNVANELTATTTGQLPRGQTRNDNDRRFLCFPYPNRDLVSAQILSILATVPSAIHGLTLYMSLAGMIWFQLLWCCRQHKFALLILAGMSFLIALVWMVIGLVVPYDWTRSNPYALGHCANGEEDDDDIDDALAASNTTTSSTTTHRGVFGMCTQVFLTVTCSVCSILWMLSAYLVVRFLNGGHHDRFEAQLVSQAGEARRIEWNRRRAEQVDRQIEVQVQRQAEEGVVTTATAM